MAQGFRAFQSVAPWAYALGQDITEAQGNCVPMDQKAGHHSGTGQLLVYMDQEAEVEAESGIVYHFQRSTLLTYFFQLDATS